jgi:hypothetical protein
LPSPPPFPLITDGRVDPAWSQIGYGKFTIKDGGLRTDSSEQGLGLLLYTKQKFGDYQRRVVFKQRAAKSNSGVYVRIDDGIAKRLDEKHAPAKRDADGKLTDDSLAIFKAASEKELGPWYAVHHGYEVQICDGAEGKRTGAVYSLAESTSLSEKKPSEWKTMLITLDGPRILVDIDDRRVTTFGSTSKDLPAERDWYESKREPTSTRPRRSADILCSKKLSRALCFSRRISVSTSRFPATARRSLSSIDNGLDSRNWQTGAGCLRQFSRANSTIAAQK